MSGNGMLRTLAALALGAALAPSADAQAPATTAIVHAKLYTM